MHLLPLVLAIGKDTTIATQHERTDDHIKFSAVDAKRASAATMEDFTIARTAETDERKQERELAKHLTRVFTHALAVGYGIPPKVLKRVVGRDRLFV